MHFMTYFIDHNRFTGLGFIQGQPTDRFGKLYVRKVSLSVFLKRNVTSHSRDMRNLMPVAFVSIKMSFWLPSLAQPKLDCNQHSFESSPDSLKQHFETFKRKPMLGVPIDFAEYFILFYCFFLFF